MVFVEMCSVSGVRTRPSTWYCTLTLFLPSTNPIGGVIRDCVGVVVRSFSGPMTRISLNSKLSYIRLEKWL